MLSHLPLQVTEFIGRTDALNNICQLIIEKQKRLVTIVGMGGIGKTRLSVAVGHSIHQHDEDHLEIVFVPLAPLNHADQLAGAIAESLEINLASSQPPADQLISNIADRSLLLILDNFEHIMAGRDTVSYLLEHCPQLHILVSSRERLNLNDELVYALHGMTLPHIISVEEAQKHEAIQLFLQIAQRVNWGFQLTDENLPYVVDICHFIDGVPLAIELSAAWLRMMSIEKIHEHLTASFDLLANSLVHVPERHRSIRAVFESSWQLLTPVEQEIYAQLSVFRGGFTEDAVTEMLSATTQDMLSFIDKSLIYQNKDNRYTLHELLRQYAEDKLEGYPDNQETIRQRHAQYYAHLLSSRESVFKVDGRHAPETIREIDGEIDNIRQMWHYALDIEDFDIIAQAIEALYHFHRIRGSYREMVVFQQDAGKKLYTSGHIDTHLALYVKIQALLALGLQLTNQMEDALIQAETAYALAKQHNRPIEIARSELALSIHWTTVGDLNKGQYYGELALKKYDDIHDIEEQMSNRVTLGWAYQLQGDFKNAERIFNKMLIQNDTRGNIYQSAQGNIWLALLHNQQGKYLTAKNYALKALTQFEATGGRAYAIAVRKNVAVAYWGLGNYPEARRYFLDTLDIFVANQQRFVAGILSTMAWMVHLMYSEGDLPLAVELGTFILNHPISNYETQEIVQKIYPTLKRELADLIFDTAEDRGNHSTIDDIVHRVRDYLQPPPIPATTDEETLPNLSEVIRETLDTGTIPESLADDTSREIASTIVERVESILEAEKSRMMSQFMENASHDLRTPITIINSSLYLLEHINDPDRKKDKLQLVKSQVNHLHQIIEKLLLMSRLDSGVSYDFYKVDVGALLRAIVAQLQTKIDQYQIKLSLILPDNPVYIEADTSYLQDAIVNLMNNAFQHTSPADSIIITCDTDPTHVIITIRDSGIGIEEKYLPFVFDRFYRIDSARQAGGQSGLGLAIVKHIIASHHGTCKLDSVPEQGTTVTLRLPLL